MDEQGIDYAIMLPTLASLIEERMRDDPDLCAAAIHALNPWMLEAWPYAYENRIFSTPIITPGVVDKAIAELEFVLDHGARVILMRPAPAWGYQGPRSFALAEFDPYWVQGARGGHPRRHPRLGQRLRPLRQRVGGVRAPRPRPSPSPSAFIGHRPQRPPRHPGRRHLADHPRHPVALPKLRIALIENGAGWVPGLLEHLDHAWKTMPQAYEEKPSDTFKRHFWMHPFHEEDPRTLVKLLGADHIIFGSDYPHVEGLADPVSYVDELHGLPEEDIRKIMGGNMMDLLGAKVPAPA